MKFRIPLIVLFCGLILGAGFLQAQTHYPQGVEGIKGVVIIKDDRIGVWGDVRLVDTGA